MKEVIDLMVKLRNAEEPYAVATVVETRGSTSARTGSKAVIDREGKVLAGWVGAAARNRPSATRRSKRSPKASRASSI
jgi:xanthine/CO dehydrogenase XdhC/CoxF family maturation factor